MTEERKSQYSRVRSEDAAEAYGKEGEDAADGSIAEMFQLYVQAEKRSIRPEKRTEVKDV